ncbi:hypothetical protein JX266_001201 [Neoarthrinium moseri]|nr:hypothetical protein JX266_001201 [Neoarthrinium moseri]
MAGWVSGDKTRSTWQVLLLPLCFISLLISGIAIGKANSYRQYDSVRLKGRWSAALDLLVTPPTARAIEQDQLLRRHYADAIGFTAETTKWLAERYPSKHLDEARALLDKYATEVVTPHDQPDRDVSTRHLTVRQNPFEAIGNLLGLGGDKSGNKNDSSILSGIGDVLKNGLAGIGQDLLGDVAGAGMFLGIGVGQGAASGLNLTTAQKAKAVGDGVAAASGMESTGLNPAIRNLGSGLSGTLVGSIDLSSVGGGDTIGPAVMGLATGVGNGAVSGLKIKNITAPVANQTNGFNLAGILETFGFGLTSTVTSNIDTNTLSGGPMSQDLAAQIPSAVLSLAQGIGSGAVSGLKINQNVAPPTGTNVPDIAGAFGFGLSQSVTSNVDINALSQGNGTNLDIMKILPSAATGLGRGLGEGIPIGLGVQPDPGTLPVKTMPDGSLDFEGISENFAMGLTSRVLANGTLSKLMSMSSPGGGALGSLDIGKAAGGLARGLLQGAGDSVKAMGGVQAILEGKATTPTGPIPETPVQFNDSLNGAAVGFGQGFGSQGVTVIQSLIGQAKVVTQKRDIDGTSAVKDTEVASVKPRQTGIVVSNSTGTTFNLSALIDAEGISTLLQKGIDALTCEGVGGLFLVLSGLANGGAIPSDPQSADTLAQFKDVLPKGVLHFTNEGNTYELDMQQVVDGLGGGLSGAADGLTINGNKASTFVGFLIFHVILGIVAMLNVLPLILGLESARNLLVRIRKPHHFTWAGKWTSIGWFFFIAPSLILIIIFGSLAMGNAGHFRTAHGVLGLLTVIDGLAAVGLHYAVRLFGSPPGQPPTTMQRVRTYNNQVLLILTIATSLSGFGDLSKITVCLTRIVSLEMAIAAGFGLSSVYTIGSTITQLDLFLEFRDARMRKKGLMGRNEGSVGQIKGKVEVVS